MVTPVSVCDQQELRAYLRARLDKLGWDIKRLADESGIHAASLYAFFSEARQKPIGFEMLSKLAKTIEDPPEKLFRLGGLIDAQTLPEGDALWQELRSAFDQLDNRADRIAAVRLVWSLGKARKEALEGGAGAGNFGGARAKGAGRGKRGATA